MPTYTVRKQNRTESSPSAGLDQEWTEYQIMDGKWIVSRCGTLEEAVREAKRLEQQNWNVPWPNLLGNQT